MISKKKTNKFYLVFKISITVLLFALSLFSISCFKLGVYQISLPTSFLLLAFAIVCLVFLIFWWLPKVREKIKKRTWTRYIYNVVCWLYLIGGICFAVLSGMIFYGMGKQPPKQEVTVVVLGCQVRGSSPSLMLTKRLDAAISFLNENPDTPCVVSGGQGPGEDISEAEAMYNYLIARGISKDRIYIEDKSINTYENMAFSAEVIAEKNLPQTVAVATDSFHQFRSHLKAKEHNLTPYAINAETPWWLYMAYFVREVLALGKTIVFGG